MDQSYLNREHKTHSWPIPRLVDEAIRKDPSLRGLVQVSPYLSPNLSSGIHQVFSHRNFPTLSKDAYCNLALGLRLASRLLGAKHLLPWWIHTAYGTRLYKGKTDKGEDEFYLEKTENYTREHARMTRCAINNLAMHVKWSFDVYLGDEFSYARTTLVKNQEPQPLHGLFKKSQPHYRCQVFLHDQYRIFAEHSYLEAPLEERLRFSFSFAATIVHELTHCFAALRRGFLKPEELFDIKDPDCELGWSWESWAFGGVILASDQKLCPPGHLVWNTWTEEVNKKHSGGYYRQLVPMDWIAGWFREEMWTGGEQLSLPQKDLVFWERSRRRVTLVEDNRKVGSKRPFAALWDTKAEYEEYKQEDFVVQQSKRLCRRSS
ncbi:uncharacterized protein IWZ02DRAFT_520199 [Phyllosticta citriasiana]|uniref:uncharacterized protein n=1 Tax=Phyllosticta citriasiana TaxID=595635 RepID=UPI0030FD99B2